MKLLISKIRDVTVVVLAWVVAFLWFSTLFVVPLALIIGCVKLLSDWIGG